MHDPDQKAIPLLVKLFLFLLFVERCFCRRRDAGVYSLAIVVAFYRTPIVLKTRERERERTISQFG